MGKIGTSILIALVLLFTTVSCESDNSSESVLTPSDTSISSAMPTATHTPAPVQTADAMQIPGMPVKFTYHVAMGNWHTEFTLNPDGTFSGYFSDNSSDATSGGGGGFNGHFTDIVKISDYEYSMRMETLDIDVDSQLAGLGNADEFRLYLPGKYIEGLPQDISYSYPILDLNNPHVPFDDPYIPFYVLCNIGGGVCFVSDSIDEYTPEAPPSLSWVVEPTLEYEQIYYCPECGVFCAGDYIIDSRTGETTETAHYGHIGGKSYFLYDAERDLLGYYYYVEGDAGYEVYPASEFASRFDRYSIYEDRMNLVYRFDSTRVNQTADEWGAVQYDFSEVIDGRFAIAHGIRFVTGFIYDECNHYSPLLTYIAVQKDNRWGIVDNNGSIVAPFIFEHALAIDNTTVYVKFNGEYGILDLT